MDAKTNILLVALFFLFTTLAYPYESGDTIKILKPRGSDTVLILKTFKKDTLKIWKIVGTDTIKLWKLGGFTSFTFNQVKMTNWSSGGEDALSATEILNLFANYTRKKLAGENSLDLGYGLMKSEKTKIRKNDDKINLTSKLGYKAFGKVFYTLLFNYRTQFDKGYQYPNDSTVVSKFNAPGYITLSLGIDYKPFKFFSIFISPASGRLTIVTDKQLADEGAFGVTPAVIENGVKIKNGENTFAEFGANLSAKLQKDLVKNVSLSSKLVLFNNYTDKEKDNRQNIDVNWEVMMNIKAGKYLTTSLFTNLVYDQDFINKTQFKDAIGVGASYKF